MLKPLTKKKIFSSFTVYGNKEDPSSLNLLIILSILTLFLISPPVSAQSDREENLKESASEHIKEGRYGEAIDLLNRYISANPKSADGYLLRAQCFEKRSEYENAVRDLRQARNLDPDNMELSEILNSITRVWYDRLQNKIEGYKREVALNPEKAVNYLEIGKSYRSMEKWNEAEEWYDKFLARENKAPADEILRYSEILDKTGHLIKGEQILQNYIKKYPDDWRLWSRYGYLNLRLGRYRTAENAFLNSLNIKPYFREAQEGLDAARKQAYVSRFNTGASGEEYPIDRYYRILRRDPGNVGIRYQLIDELAAAERLEEAYNQLHILEKDHSGEQRFKEKLKSVNNLRDKLYKEKIRVFEEQLQMHPGDKEAVKNITRYYKYFREYDKALTHLENYLSAHPSETDKDLLFEYAELLAWNEDYQKSAWVTDRLIKEHPENIEYRLLHAQVSVWTRSGLKKAENYLKSVLSEQPRNIDALIAMGGVRLAAGNFTEAEFYADQASMIDPLDIEISKLRSGIEFEKFKKQEEEIYALLETGRNSVIAGNCSDAVPYYKKYISLEKPGVSLLKEYADALFCAGEYKEALSTYNEILSKGYDFETGLNRAKAIYAMGDSEGAVTAFENLSEREPGKFGPKIYLGDSYAKTEEYDKARDQYNELLTWNLDRSKKIMIEKRLDMLPVSTFRAVLNTFPYYVGFLPKLNFYSDDLSFQLTQTGGLIELGFTNFISFGISYVNSIMYAEESSLKSNILNQIKFTGSRHFTSFKGYIYLNITERFRAGAGKGRLNSGGTDYGEESDAFIVYENKDRFMLKGSFMNTDASLILLSPYLLDLRYGAKSYSVDGYIKNKAGVQLSVFYNHISIDDGNQGNELRIRPGRKFYDYLSAGYEYYYADFEFNSMFYYSPGNFESHSIWIDSDLEKEENFKLKLGGKIGYVPQADFILMEGFIKSIYRVSKSFHIDGTISAGSNSRENVSYKAVSGTISANIYF